MSKENNFDQKKEDTIKTIADLIYENSVKQQECESMVIDSGITYDTTFSRGCNEIEDAHEGHNWYYLITGETHKKIKKIKKLQKKLKEYLSDDECFRNYYIYKQCRKLIKKLVKLTSELEEYYED